MSVDISNFNGVRFYDISPLLCNSELFNKACMLMASIAKNSNCSCVAGLDARGFLFGSVVANKLNVPFVMIRKADKLPNAIESDDKYDTEYSSEKGLCLSKLCVSYLKDNNVALIDDSVATGGTIKAATKLLEKAGASNVTPICFLRINPQSIYDNCILDARAAIINVGSTSSIKASAVTRAFPFSRIIFQAQDSGVPEQPISKSVIERGATYRAQNCNGYGMKIGIENGVVSAEGLGWFDVACIHVIFPDGNTKTLWSDMVKLPNDYKPKQDKTWGQHYFPDNHDDPHFQLTGVSRVEYLTNTLKLI